jgi:hypothetical protein
MSIKILKTIPLSDFTKVCNKLLQDKALSCNARFLLIIINSLPPDFRATYGWIEKTMRCKRSASIALLKELVGQKKAWKSQDSQGKDTFEFERFSPSKNFTTIRNQIIKDSELSPEARMVLMLVLSQAENFTPYFEWIRGSIGAGQNKTQNHLAELRKVGYAKYEHIKVKGEFKTVYYFSPIQNPSYWGSLKVTSKLEKKWTDHLSEIKWHDGEKDVSKETNKLLIDHWKYEFSEIFKAIFENKYYFNGSMEKDIRDLVHIAIEEKNGIEQNFERVKHIIYLQVYESFVRVLSWKKSRAESMSDIAHTKRCTPAFFKKLINETKIAMRTSEKLEGCANPREMKLAYLKLIYARNLNGDSSKTVFIVNREDDFRKLVFESSNDGFKAIQYVDGLKSSSKKKRA